MTVMMTYFTTVMNILFLHYVSLLTYRSVDLPDRAPKRLVPIHYCRNTWLQPESPRSGSVHGSAIGVLGGVVGALIDKRTLCCTTGTTNVFAFTILAVRDEHDS